MPAFDNVYLLVYKRIISKGLFQGFGIRIAFYFQQLFEEAQDAISLEKRGIHGSLSASPLHL
jgi:hypothetical protein